MNSSSLDGFGPAGTNGESVVDAAVAAEGQRDALREAIRAYESARCAFNVADAAVDAAKAVVAAAENKRADAGNVFRDAAAALASALGRNNAILDGVMYERDIFGHVSRTPGLVL